jgi:predicted nucleotidyltransferase
VRKTDQSLPHDIDARLKQASERLSEDPRVLFAYVFGGLGRGERSPLSDIDVAVYLKDGTEIPQAKLDLIGQLIGALGTDDVDLVILNEAPLSLAGRIQQSARILMDNASSKRREYESLIRRMFADFAISEQALLRRRFGLG